MFTCLLTQPTSKHARKHGAIPPWVSKKKERKKKKEEEKKSSISIQTILVLFVLAKATWAVIKETPDIT